MVLLRQWTMRKYPVNLVIRKIRNGPELHDRSDLNQPETNENKVCTLSSPFERARTNYSHSIVPGGFDVMS